MRTFLLVVMLSILTIFNGYSSAINCNCTVAQVESNTVSPCNIEVGTVVTVSTVYELQSAISQVNNSGGNMTVLIQDGDYQIASTSSFPYITGSNVVFRSASGNRDNVIIRGTGNAPTNGTEDGFLIAGNDVTIADLTIREVGNHGIQVSGHNFHAYNVRLQDTYEQMIKGSSYNPTIENGVIECSLFEYTQGIGPNWYIGGIDIHKGVGWTVNDNVFKNIISPGYAIAEHAIHFWNNCVDNTIERNVIYNCDRGIGFGLGTNGNQNVGGIIRNNIIYNEGIGQFNDVGIGLESSPDTKVYNNTVYVDYQNAIEYRWTTTVNVDIANNLTNRNIASRDGATGNLQTNYTNANDAWFVDLLNGDLRIATSVVELFDQGTNFPNDVLVDLDQNPRPLNMSTDIGATEFGVVSNIQVDNNCIELLSDTANGMFSITGTLNQYTIEVLDVFGNVLQTIPSNGFVTTFNLSNLTTAYYFVKVTSNNNALVSMQKIIVL